MQRMWNVIKIVFLTALFCSGTMFAMETSAKASGDALITLPQPALKSGVDLFDAVRERVSTRAFADRELKLQDLSDVLWAAGGQKTPGGKWVIPYAMRTEPTCKIYITGAKGTYLYDGAKHNLRQVLADDLRGAVAEQNFVSTAPYVILLVSSPEVLLEKMHDRDPDHVMNMTYISYGAIMQDVYLTAAAKGLATCYIGSVKPDALKAPLKLLGTERFFGVMPIGYPEK